MNKDVKALSDLFIEIGGLIKKYEDNVRIRSFASVSLRYSKFV